MIKNYNQFNESLEFPQTEKEIRLLCKEYWIIDYTINSDMSIDVNDDVDLKRRGLVKIPLNFRRVEFNFNCSENQIIDLNGSPTYVGEDFLCHSNLLDSLKGGPKEVKGEYSCDQNGLESLEGISSLIGSGIYCYFNNIKSFKGIPEDFNGNFLCDNNPIHEIYKLFNKNSKCIYWLNEYDVIQGDNIIMDRLEEVFHQLDMEVPDIKRLKDYNLI